MKASKTFNVFSISVSRLGPMPFQKFHIMCSNILQLTHV